MRSAHLKLFCGLSLALFLAGCGDSANLPAQQTNGANPTLPEPNKTLLPTVGLVCGTPNSGLATLRFAGGKLHRRKTLTAIVEGLHMR